MTDKDWTKVSEEDHPLPGPKALFISGYDSDQLTDLRAFFDELGFSETPLKPCTKEQIEDPLEKALTDDTAGEPLGQGKLPNVLVISGMHFQDVQTIMKNFAQTGLPRPIFATSTPSNLSFKVKELLLHLLEEQKMAREMASKKNG